MPRNDISALRDHLFDSIERLKSANDPDCDPNEKMDVATAHAINNAAKIIVESAKLEVQMISIIAKAGDTNPDVLLKSSRFLNSHSDVEAK